MGKQETLAVGYFNRPNDAGGYEIPPVRVDLVVDREAQQIVALQWEDGEQQAVARFGSVSVAKQAYSGLVTEWQKP